MKKQRLIIAITLIAILSGCAVKPIPENYLKAINNNDIETLKELDDQHFRYLYTTQGKAQYPIHYAVNQSKPNIIRYLVESRYDINQVANRRTPLMLAATLGNKKVIETLLELGADINRTSVDGYIALTDLRDRDVHLAPLLFNNQTDLTRENIVGKTLLQVLKDKPKIAKFVAEQEASRNNAIKELIYALEKDNSQKVADYIDAGYDLNSPISKGRTALIWSIYNNAPKSFQLLLNANVNINKADNDNVTPLYYASINNRDSMLKTLLTSGANPDLASNNGWTPLMAAVDDYHPKIVKALLANGANPNLKQINGWTALHFTVNESNKPEHDYGDIAAMLIKGGASLNAKNNAGNNPLTVAVINNKPKTTEVLLQHSTYLNLAGNDGIALLMAAANNNSFDVVKVLKAAGVNLNLADNDGVTSLMKAANNNYSNVVKVLLTAGANPYLKNINGWTALHFAAAKQPFVEGKRKKLEHDDSGIIADMLIKSGADINALTNAGVTPIYLAAESNKLKIATVLLKHKADPNLSTDSGFTPLNVATDYDLVSDWGLRPFNVATNYDLVKALLAAGANPNLVGETGWSPLHGAAQYKNFNTAKALLAAGANPNSVLSGGYTPLMAAVSKNSPDTVKVLLAAGANPNQKDNWGATALHNSVSNERIHVSSEVVMLLLKAKADLSVKTSSGYTPLMLAAVTGKMELAKVFIKSGAYINEVNKKDEQRSALDYAISHNHYEIVKLLKSHNAISGFEQAE